MGISAYNGLLFLSPSAGEIIIILLVVIMLFGAKKLPELARGLGKGIREVKNATGDIQREIKEGMQGEVKKVSEFKKDLDDTLK